MNIDASRATRRWSRFSLRTFMLVVIVTSVAFGWLGVKVKWARDQQTVDQLLQAEPEQVSKLLPKITSYRGWVVSALEGVLSLDTTLPAAPADRHLLYCRQSNAAVALTTLGRGEKVWPLFKHSADPTRRSYLIDRYAASGGSSSVLMKQLGKESDASIRRGLILALGGFDKGQFSEADAFITLLLNLHERDLDSGVHGATDWVLRRWQREGWLADKDQEQWHTTKRQLATGRIEGGRNWYVTKQGLTMSVLEGGEYWYGEPSDDGVPPEKRKLDNRFAISNTEVTVEQFRRFLQGKEDVHNEDVSPEDASPVNQVSLYLAAEYCNWLSEQEGIPKDQWCYEANATQAFAEGMKFHSERNGYRLPTQEEWEYACRAGSSTAFGFGDADELLQNYARFSPSYVDVSSTHTVASLKPNDFGLFDMHGNVWEWCQSRYVQDEVADSPESEEVRDVDTRVLRGGSWDCVAASCLCSYRIDNRPFLCYDFLGIRVARTYP